MKYRTKLYFALAGIALTSVASGMGLLYIDLKHLLFRAEESKAITVAATTAALIDVDLLKQIRTPQDENTPAYRALKEDLQKARDANRRTHIYIRFLYTIAPNPQDPKEIIYLVDAEENPQLVSHVGEVDTNAYVSGIIFHLHEYYSPGRFIKDQWGTWLSGFSPIYDSDGNYLATVGADISMAQVMSNLRWFSVIFIYGILGALMLSLIGAYFLSLKVTRSLNVLYSCVKEIGQGNLYCSTALESHDEFEDLGQEINKMTKGLREREFLKMNFARYVSKHVLEKILSSGTSTKLEGERRKITVLFSDIRQFTQLAEHLPPEQVVGILNEYFEVMLDVIFAHQGTLDKFIGDGIMVEFGAPLDDPLQEWNAVITAIEMQRELKKLGKRWEQEGKPVIGMGVGVNTGLAVVGSIGSERRLEYTAIGDTVNVAARLEQTTKVLKQHILISESTYEAVKGQFKFIDLGSMTLHGRDEPIHVYAIDPFSESSDN